MNIKIAAKKTGLTQKSIKYYESEEFFQVITIEIPFKARLQLTQDKFHTFYA